MSGRKRVGILGGTFDPIHNGHLMIAGCAYDQFGLDEVRFLPAGIPPHKRIRKGGASDQQRLRMTELAVRDDPRFSVDPSEIERGGISFTKDTLQILKQREPGTDFYFIVGADSLLSLDSWREPETICSLCHLLVAGRDSLEQEAVRLKIEELQSRFHASISLISAPLMPISSHELRRKRREQEPIDEFVPAPVLAYLDREEVYRS